MTKKLGDSTRKRQYKSRRIGLPAPLPVGPEASMAVRMGFPRPEIFTAGTCPYCIDARRSNRGMVGCRVHAKEATFRGER